MGTRADFYGMDEDRVLVWLGSIAWDGYPGGIEDVSKAQSDTEWRTLVDAFLASREDATRPDQGWPWPWDDSRTTDYAYHFDGQVMASRFGSPWFAASEDPEPEEPQGEAPSFPDMSERKSITFGKRSGAIVIGGPPLP